MGEMPEYRVNTLERRERVGFWVLFWVYLRAGLNASERFPVQTNL
jgi:hypothetical protein